MADTVPFKDIRKKLENAGWELARISGSHHIFTATEKPPISIPVHHGKVKRVYDKKANKAIEEHGDQA